ncbi:hypothetical protein WMF38_56890 [Sorangium sp. So ce118]
MTATLLYVTRNGCRVSLSVGLQDGLLHIAEAGKAGPWSGRLTRDERAKALAELGEIEAYEERRAA